MSKPDKSRQDKVRALLLKGKISSEICTAVRVSAEFVHQQRVYLMAKGHDLPHGRTGGTKIEVVELAKRLILEGYTDKMIYNSINLQPVLISGIKLALQEEGADILVLSNQEIKDQWEEACRSILGDKAYERSRRHKDELSSISE